MMTDAQPAIDAAGTGPLCQAPISRPRGPDVPLQRLPTTHRPGSWIVPRATTREKQKLVFRARDPGAVDVDQDSTMRGVEGQVVAHEVGKTFYSIISGIYGFKLAEREGFEPPVQLPVLRISSATHSTTLPPLRRSKRKLRWSSRALPRRGRGFKLSGPMGSRPNCSASIDGDCSLLFTCLRSGLGRWPLWRNW